MENNKKFTKEEIREVVKSVFAAFPKRVIKGMTVGEYNKIMENKSKHNKK